MIVKTEGVCGGSACIEHTRIPVWIVEEWNREPGITLQILIGVFDMLTELEILEALQYAKDNKEEIDREIKENEEGNIFNYID